MKFLAFMGMMMATLDCLFYATDEKDHIFSSSYHWFWYVIALAWFIQAIALLVSYKIVKK